MGPKSTSKQWLSRLTQAKYYDSLYHTRHYAFTQACWGQGWVKHWDDVFNICPPSLAVASAAAAIALGPSLEASSSGAMVPAPTAKANAKAKVSVSAVKKQGVAESRQILYAKAVNQLHAALKISAAPDFVR
jgi:hypothetical protein